MPVVQWWSPSNPNTIYPANREAANRMGVLFYENASYVRLQDVNLSFTPGAGLTDRFGLQNLRFYINGQNLWTRTGWTGLDPELSQAREIPLARVVVAGMNVTF
jgi:hypothetical protein